MERSNSDPGSSTRVTWLGGGEVSVYFVRNSFSLVERQLLWQALETWAQKERKKGRQINFVPSGETGGLIDCAGCLTIATQAASAYASRQRVSFNSLRHDEAGRPISAWIGFEADASTTSNLRPLMLQALERGLALDTSPTARAGK
jgi:hypothetical protein